MSSKSHKKARKQAHADKSRDIPYRDDEQTYARVTKMLGNGRLVATCADGVERQCKIRGAMRKREWVRPGDVVLLALRGFDDDKADVIFRYRDDEVHRLKRVEGNFQWDRRGDADNDNDEGHMVSFEHDEDIDLHGI